MAMDIAVEDAIAIVEDMDMDMSIFAIFGLYP